MSAIEVIAEIKTLPREEKEQVWEHLHREMLAEVPESFRRGMADALAGRGVDMETALNEVPPSRP